jgi:EAL domain-containing protein (putative c-di-GMP-specific phosphodiesterase class I)
LASSFDLLHAIETNELVLHYQPIIDLESHAHLSLEALVRWQHPDQGLLGPERFLHLAENTALGRALTGWVLSRALRDCAGWRQDGVAAGVSVNVIPDVMTPDWIVAEVGLLLRTYHLPGEALTIEITERRWPVELSLVKDTIDALAGLGVCTSLDDFGMGDSSLARLARLQFDEIKIDRSFIADATTRTESRAIVKFTVDLARTLGVRAVAEGMELDADLELMIELGVEAGQGYLISPPRPLDQLEILGGGG